MNKNLFINYGASYTKQLVAKTIRGSPVNLSNRNVRIVISKHEQSTRKYIFNAVITNAAAGEFKLQLTSTDTLQLPRGVLMYSIFQIDHLLNINLLFGGVITVDDSLYDPSLLINPPIYIPETGWFIIDGGSASYVFTQSDSILDGGFAGTIFTITEDGGSAIMSQIIPSNSILDGGISTSVYLISDYSIDGGIQTSIPELVLN